MGVVQAPKKEKKEDDEDDKALKAKQREEAAALKAAKEKGRLPFFPTLPLMIKMFYSRGFSSLERYVPLMSSRLKL